MNKFDGYPLYDPRSVVADRLRFRRDHIAALLRANSFYMPAGRWPSRGWILLSRKDLDDIDNYATNLVLEIGDSNHADNIGTLKNLTVVHARCVTRGIAADDNALYLVEITDGRGIVANRWFKFPLQAQYNIRAPAYPQTFHPNSMNSGTTWTWSTMLENIWDKMSTHLGAWPGLPSNPKGTPEGFWFTGVPAWKALNDVLDHLGMNVAVDHTKDAPYTIVGGGTADATFTNLQSQYATHLLDDQELVDTGSGRVPKTIDVFFRKRNEVYGTEETTPYRNDEMAYQWNQDAVHTITVNAPSTFSNAVGKHFIWSDFTIRHDVGNDPNADDLAEAQTIAEERVTQYFERIYWSTLGRLSQTYARPLPFVTGSQVDGVKWYQDYTSQEWNGWRTEIVRGPRPPWPEVVVED